MLGKRILAIAAVATLFSSAASATAPSALTDDSSYTIELRGYVPVICNANVNASQVSVQSSQVEIGQLSEFCNNANGYEVWVDYTPSLAGSTLLVDGQSVDLTEAGTARITHVDHAGIASHDLALNLETAETQGNISVRIVAL
jgi:hypothetical protein